MNWFSSSLLKPLAHPNVKNETTTEIMRVMIDFPMKAFQSFHIGSSANKAPKATIKRQALKSCSASLSMLVHPLTMALGIPMIKAYKMPKGISSITAPPTRQTKSITSPYLNSICNIRNIHTCDNPKMTEARSNAINGDHLALAMITIKSKPLLWLTINKSKISMKKASNQFFMNKLDA
ncbi:hypothetical protein [Peribacillus frigoritolerans]|uniref:hypothetical protein n=1 Tax=Peribacillus frigoritolerans TaxID=450367 RepID=UPI00330652E5